MPWPWPGARTQVRSETSANSACAQCQTRDQGSQHDDARLPSVAQGQHRRKPAPSPYERHRCDAARPEIAEEAKASAAFIAPSWMRPNERVCSPEPDGQTCDDEREGPPSRRDVATTHRVKGLEFDRVIVAGANADLLPACLRVRPRRRHPRVPRAPGAHAAHARSPRDRDHEPGCGQHMARDDKESLRTCSDIQTGSVAVWVGRRADRWLKRPPQPTSPRDRTKARSLRNILGPRDRTKARSPLRRISRSIIAGGAAPPHVEVSGRGTCLFSHAYKKSTGIAQLAVSFRERPDIRGEVSRGDG